MNSVVDILSYRGQRISEVELENSNIDESIYDELKKDIVKYDIGCIKISSDNKISRMHPMHWLDASIIVEVNHDEFDGINGFAEFDELD